MSKIKFDPKDPWPRGFDEHRAQQIIEVAKSTTPKQRLENVEAMLDFAAKAGKPYHQQRDLLEKLRKEKIEQEP